MRRSRLPVPITVAAGTAAGNEDDSPATRSFSVDTSVPADTTAPETVKESGPKKKSTAKKASFVFSSEAGASFECHFDDALVAPCVSPARVKKLKPGKHVFTAAATDGAGNTDETPARWKFRTVRK